jgi:hypothetical protein
MLALACSSLNLFKQIIFALIVLIYLVLLLRRSQPLRLRFDTGWVLTAQGGSELALQLQQATVWPMLIVLRFRDPQYSRLSWRGAHSLTLLRDNLSADDWRHLRIYLRHFDVYGDLSFNDID